LELNAILRLEDFERFVFIMSVLEHYSEHDCVLPSGARLEKSERLVAEVLRN
jgi:hypothetical protein